MVDWTVHHLFNKAKATLDKPSSEHLKAYAQSLMRAGLPVIFTLKHLSNITNVDYSLLRTTVERHRESANYRIFAIKKRSGGRRHIHAVTGELLRTQQFINTEILQKLKPHHASFAFHSGGGIRACASMHCGARWLFQFDLADFFYSINESDVYKIFADSGYRPLLSFELARLCTTTRLPEHLSRLLHTPTTKFYDFYQSTKDIPMFGPMPCCFQMGVLPQGAPSSPMLSNLVARGLDEALTDYADQHGLVYTRYADDITLSTGEDLPKSLSKLDIHRSVIRIIRKNKFRENKGKTRIAGPGSKKLVLGLLVDGPSPRLSKNMYKRIDRHLYAIHKYGLTAVATYENFDSPLGFYNHLSGLISFIKDVDLERWQKFYPRFKEISFPLDLNH